MMSSIALDAWCQASRISFKSVIGDPTCMQICNCVLSKSAENIIELTNSTSSDEMSAGVTIWVHNVVYSFTNSDKKLILSPSGWFNDSIISSTEAHVTAFSSHVWTATTNTSACLGF